VNACLVLAAICGPAANPPAAAPEPPTVELRLTSGEDGDAKLLEESLRRQLSDRLLQDGYRVVSGGQTASVVVWVHLGPAGARVQTRGVQERVETIAAGDPEVVALEVLQLTIALVDEHARAEAAVAAVEAATIAAAAVGAAAVGAAAVEAAAVEAAAVEDGARASSSAEELADAMRPLPARRLELADAPAEPRPSSFTLTAQGGLAVRTGGADGAFGMGLRAGRRRGIGGGLELTVIPSAGAGVRVVESMPTALLDWRIGFGRHGIAAFAAFAGLHVHHYRQDGPAGARDVRLAPSLGTTVRLAFLGSRGLVAFGGLRAGWSGGRWVHVFDGEQTWERSALLVAIELGMGWDFPWGQRA
jgi:hypothetical protein